MAYKKKHKESATIRYRELADGRKSIYLDIRVDGNRQYRTLNLYLLPETDFLSKQKNKETLAQAENIKEETIIEKMYARAGLDDRSFLGHTTLVDWMQKYYEKQSAEEKSTNSLLAILRLQNEIREFDPRITLEEVDLDFDLGYDSTWSGLDVLKYMKKYGVKCKHINIHSTHPRGREMMIQYATANFADSLVTGWA